MKKTLSLLICLILVFSFASCGKGASVAIGRVRYENEIRNLFMRDETLVSFVETITYFDDKGEERFSYTLTYERAEDIMAGFNIVEAAGDTVLYAYEGSVYTVKNGEVCAVLLFPSGYQEFITPYIEGKFPFDGEKLSQRYSKTENGRSIMGYATKPTAQMVGWLAEYGVTKDTTILSEYNIDEDGFICYISYSAEDENGEKLLAHRTFKKGTEKTGGLFDKVSALTPSVKVHILYAGEEGTGRTFTVPEGVSVGIETGKNEYAFYYDKELTRPYSYMDGKITKETVIYAKKIGA